MRYAAITTIVLALALGFMLGGVLSNSASAVPPPNVGRVIIVAENLAISPPAQSVITPFFDVSDCRLLSVYTDASANMTVYLHPSPDGAFAPDRAKGITSGQVAGETVSFFNPVVAAAQVAVQFERIDTTALDTVNMAWAYCSH